MTVAHDDAGRTATARPLWFTIAVTALTLIGLGVSVYMTYAHYNKDALVCTEGATIDCSAVTTSDYAVLLGIPLPLLGLAFFIAMLALITPPAWRSRSPLPRWGRLASTFIGMAFVIYLVTVEIAILHKICLWCTAVHVITAMLFVLVLIDEYRRIGESS